MAALASLLGMAAPWDRVNSPRYHRPAQAGLNHVSGERSDSCGTISITPTNESAALSIWKPLSPSVPHQLALGTAYGATDIGTARDSNEDNFFIAAHPCLLVVADGMGGHEGGEIASADAIALLHQFLRDADLSAPAPAPPPADPHTHRDDATLRAIATLREAIEYANACIYRANQVRHRADGAGMGTTLTGIWQPGVGLPALLFHIGDSRLYRYRDGRLVQLTRDHTWYQQALEANAPPPLPPRNVLLQALGPGPIVTPDVQVLAPTPGDVYLLCSDGLHGDSQPRDVAAILARARADNLDACCAALIELAKQDGSRDNITALLFKCPE